MGRGRRKRYKKYVREVNNSKNELCGVMNTKEKIDLYIEFRSLIDSFHYNGHINFNEYIEFLHTKKDKRIIKYNMRLREHNINKILFSI